MVRAEQRRLLERVSDGSPAGWGVRVDATKVEKSVSWFTASTPGRREKVRAFLKAHAGPSSGGMLRPRYSLDAQSGRVQSRPNLQVLPHDVFAATEGHELVDVRGGVELACCLRDAGLVDLARVSAEDGDVWSLLAERLGQGGGDGLPTPEWEEFRQSVKRSVWGLLWGLDPLRSAVWEKEPEEKRRAAAELCARVEALCPGMRLVGTREYKRKVIRRRSLATTEVYLDVGLEAESVPGVRVCGFWFGEPLVEAPVGTGEAVGDRIAGRVRELLRAGG